MPSLYNQPNRIEMLKNRKNRCVCRFCGGRLDLRRVIFNDVIEARVELFCDNCDRIEFGIEPEIYLSAKNFVEQLEFDYYDMMDENEKKLQMNVAKVAEIVAWNCKNLGLLNQDGFQVPLNMEEAAFATFLTLKDEEIDTTTDITE